MITDGVLDDPKVDAAAAIHGWPGIPLGKIGLRTGAIMASSDSFDLQFKGKGGHAAYPQACVDPIFTAMQTAMNLFCLVSRESGAEDPVVISFTKMEAGTAHNIIPETASLSGTIRCLSETKRKQTMRRFEEITKSSAAAMRAKVEVVFKPGCPVTYNDTKMTLLAEKSITKSFSAKAVQPVNHASMGGEDFSFFAQKVPSVFMHLGLGDRPFCHNPQFDFDDRALPIGIEAFVSLAKTYLGEP